MAAPLPYADLRKFSPVRVLDDPDFGVAQDKLVGGAIHFPEGGYVNDPQLAAHNLQCAAEAAGGEFRFNSEITEIRRTDGRVAGITLADGAEIDAPIVVNAAGPHSTIINRMAGVLDGMKIRTHPLRQEVSVVPAPENVDIERVGFVLGDDDTGGYCRPETGNSLLLASSEPECDDLQWVDDPDNYNTELSDQWTVQVYRVAQRIPTLPIPGQATGVVNLYDVADDWIPIYDKSDLPGFYMAVGTSGNQFKNTPVVGPLMAALIEHCEAGADHDAAPLVFPLERIGVDLDLGFFSRNRAVNQDSSMSVRG